jgi:hypothetical protein
MYRRGERKNIVFKGGGDGNIHHATPASQQVPPIPST